MFRSWTFGQKIGAVFALAMAFLVTLGGVAYLGSSQLLVANETLTQSTKVMQAMSAAFTPFFAKDAAIQAYMASGDPRFLVEVATAERALVVELGKVRVMTTIDPRQQRLIDEAVPLVQVGTDHLRTARTDFEPSRKSLLTLRAKMGEIYQVEMAKLNVRNRIAQGQAALNRAVVLGTTVLALLTMGGFGWFLIRSLSGQIAGAVTNLQSSSIELRTSANQQATASTEQAASMNELATTMKEILASSRHITENAQQVARIAAETTAAAGQGEGAVAQAHEAMLVIRRHVDLIVTHMLALGRKSQQVGSILDIIKELAEQTNILAINATIESAAAGEGGKRFAAVADEIRKLADRVATATREIRPLIDDIRAAANTTVMATEEGSKAVEVGNGQFANLASAFDQIVGLVSATEESAREIELGTKQQTSAIEQVNHAISDVAQAAKETEVSSRQTLQTSTQLTVVSRELAQIVQRTGNA